MSKTHQIAWAAGFFDGEGYITIGRRNTPYKDKTYYHHYLRIGINHVAREPIDEMYRIFGGNIEYNTNVIGNRKPRYRWICNTKKANEVLKMLMPFLKNKNRACETAFEYIQTIGINGQRMLPGTEEKREELRKKLVDINSKD